MAGLPKVMTDTAPHQEEMNSLSCLLRTFLPDHHDFPFTDSAQEILQHVTVDSTLPNIISSILPENNDCNGHTSFQTDTKETGRNERRCKSKSVLPKVDTDDSDNESSSADDSDATVDLSPSDLEQISSKPKSPKSKKALNDMKEYLRLKKNYVCFVCDSGFKSLPDYKNHMLSLCGSASWQFRCVDCGNSFTNKYDLHSHEKLAPYELWVDKEMQRKPLYLQNYSSDTSSDHGIFSSLPEPEDKDSLFLCNYCGKPIKIFRVFLDHVYNHAMAKAFRCALCPDSFEAPCMLRFHIDTQHSQILPFQCQRCLRRFKLKCSLSTHSKYCKTEPGNLKYAEEIQFIDQLNQQRKFQGTEDEQGTSQFSCPVCTVMFDSPEELQVHLMKHDETRPFQCERCGQGCASKMALQKHMQLHDTVKDFKCEICGVELVSRSGYKAHLRGHRNIEALQVQAGISSPTQSAEDLVNKIYASIEVKAEIISDDEKYSEGVSPKKAKLHTKKTVYPTYPCPMCSTMFFTGGAKFQAHVRKEHPDAPLEECNICHKKFYGLNNLIKHKDIHRLYSQTFPCEECGRVFRRKYALEVHKKIHSFKKFVKCDICDQEFRFVSEVEKHKHAKHKYDRALNIYKCNICGQKFPVLSHLSVHCYYHYAPDAKAFECDLCKISFKTATDLKQHIYQKHDHLMKTNSENERILVPKSGLSIPGFDEMYFKQEFGEEEDSVSSVNESKKDSSKVSDLKSPSKSLTALGEMSAAAANNLSCSTAIMEGNEGQAAIMRLIPNSDGSSEMGSVPQPSSGVEAYNLATRQSMLQSRYLKRFSCETCTKTFATKSDLKTHVRTHSGETPFKCDFCERSFKQRGHRKLHIQVAHTKEMPYKCTHCEAAFPTRYRFQVHLKRHGGVKEYKCAYCQKEFYTKGKMNEHKKLRHKKEWDEEQKAIATFI